MRHPLLTLVALCALLAPMTQRSADAQAMASPTSATPARARVIVKFKADSVLLRKQVQSATERHSTQARALGQRVGMALEGGAGVTDRTQVVLATGVDSAELAARLAQEPDIEYAVVDHRRRAFAPPNDPLYGAGVPGNGPAVGQWYLRAPAGAVTSSLNVEAAWDITLGSPSIIVAVLDTGVRFDHADMGSNLLPGYDMVSDVPTANDLNGRDSDASDPGDWVTQAENDLVGGDFEGCGRADSSWHGTQMSGIVAALTNNGVGMAGVGRSVRVLPVRVLGKCGGFDSDIMAGMRWAAGLSVPGLPVNTTPARVINLSLGGPGECNTVNSVSGSSYADIVAEVTAAGTAIVASAGNSAGQAVSVPAKCSGVIGVGALRHVGTKVGFSDLGPEISISAPGGNCVNSDPADPCLFPILTSTNAGTTTPTPGSSIYTDSFNASVGTSFSAPLVAGTAALMLSARPSLTPAEVRSMMRSSARPFPTSGGSAGSPQCHAPNGTDQVECYCTTSTCGAGMLDAGAAVQAAVVGPPAPSSDGGGGGGGALGLHWLLGLLAAVVGVRSGTRRPS